MDEVSLKTQLKKYSVIGIDTEIFVYHFEKNPLYLPLSIVLFGLIEKGELIGVTSIISLLEILVEPKKEHKLSVVNEYKFLLATFPNLAIGTIDEEVVDLASTLKATYDLTTADAIQIATAKLYNASLFITTDVILKKVKELEIMTANEILVE